MSVRQQSTTPAGHAGATGLLPHDPPVRFALDGQDLVISGDTGWWIETLSCCDWLTLVLEAGLGERLDDHDDAFDLADAASLALLLSKAVTGYDWPIACRLAAVAALHWSQVELWAISRTGLDLLTAPPRRVLAAVYALLLEGCEKDSDRTRLESKLTSPTGIAGISMSADAGPWTPADEAASFAAFAAELGQMRAGGEG